MTDEEQSLEEILSRARYMIRLEKELTLAKTSFDVAVRLHAHNIFPKQGEYPDRLDF